MATSSWKNPHEVLGLASEDFGTASTREEALASTDTSSYTRTPYPTGNSFDRNWIRPIWEWSIPTDAVHVDYELDFDAERIGGSGAQTREFTNVQTNSDGNLTIDIGVDGGSSDNDGADYYVYFARARITYTVPPNAPTPLSPSGDATIQGLSLEVSTSNPISGDPITDTEYEVRRASDSALMWDSGWRSGTSTSYGGSTLSDGTGYEWRARNRNSEGAASDWSSWQSFTAIENESPSASAVSPSGSASDLTPTIRWNYSDPDGDAQSAYQIQVRRASDNQLMWDTGQSSGSTKSVTYAGDSLSNGVQYRWRVRVQDTAGLWSDYTSYESFTPAEVPDPPSGLEPSGLIDTLTPTVSGTYNQASGGSEESYQYQIRQSTTTIYDSGEVSGSIGTGQSYGTNNPSDSPSTPPDLDWGTSYSIRARSKDTSDEWSSWSGWQSFSTNAAPTEPSNLQPDGAITGNTTPTLSWNHNDPDGDEQTEVEIELRESDDTLVTGYGPKELEQSAEEHEVTETLTDDPSTSYKWRVRTLGVSGPGFSPWSDWVEFTVAEAPELDVTAPTDGQELNEPSLTVEWTYSGSSTQKTYRVRLYASDETTIEHDSGSVSSDDTEYVIPASVFDNDVTYLVKVDVTDQDDLPASSSDIEITTSWTPPATLSINVSAEGSQ